MDLYPLLCEPHCQPRVWGGRGLAERFGKALPPGAAIGETWEVADLPEGVSTLANGSSRGRTLTELVAELGSTLLGTAWPPGRFPLLVKLLDAREDLSVQVHPADDDCRGELAGHRGKDECWLILHAEPGAAVVHGVRTKTHWPTLAAAAADGTILAHLRRLPVRPGDVVHVPPGTIHALLAGVMVLEVQQPSDSTFRIYDHGRGRELHLAAAARVARLTPAEPIPAPVLSEFGWGRHETLLEVAYRLERLAVRRPVSWSIDPRTVQVLVLVEGGGTISGGGVEVGLRAGQTVVLPARLGRIGFRPAAGGATLVLAGAGGARLGPGETA